MPWGLAAAAVGVAGTVYSSKKSSKAAEEAGEREGAASEEAIARQEAAYAEAQTALAPYARQEAAYSSQMAAQMGVAPIQGGAQDPWGYAPTGYQAGHCRGRTLIRYRSRLTKMSMSRRTILALSA